MSAPANFCPRKDLDAWETQELHECCDCSFSKGKEFPLRRVKKKLPTRNKVSAHFGGYLRYPLEVRTSGGDFDVENVSDSSCPAMDEIQPAIFHVELVC
jgi:hypothetical protein